MEPAVACDEVVFLNTVSENLDDFTVVAAIDMDDVDADTTVPVIPCAKPRTARSTRPGAIFTSCWRSGPIIRALPIHVPCS